MTRQASGRQLLRLSTGQDLLARVTAICMVVTAIAVSFGCERRSDSPPTSSGTPAPAGAASASPTSASLAKAKPQFINPNRDSGGTLTLISDKQCEIAFAQAGTVLGEYTRENGRLRVVAVILGTNRVLYFRDAPNGLVDEEGKQWVRPDALKDTPEVQADMQKKACSQARGIHQGCVIWAQSAQGKFPPDVGAIVEGAFVAPPLLISPFDSCTLPNDIHTWPASKRTEWLNTNSSFAYITGRVDDGDQGKLVLFEKLHKGAKQTGIAMVYNDSHTEWTPLETARQVVKAQTGKTLEEWSR